MSYKEKCQRYDNEQRKRHLREFPDPELESALHDFIINEADHISGVKQSYLVEEGVKILGVTRRQVRLAVNYLSAVGKIKVSQFLIGDCEYKTPRAKKMIVEIPSNRVQAHMKKNV